MITFYIINQPESTWMKEGRCEGISDTSLTKLGKAQTTKLARYFTQKTLSGILSSRLHRSIQAAKIINQFVPVKLVREARLNNMNLGIWQGKFPEEIEARYPAEYALWKTDPERANIPDGESISNIKVNIESLIKAYTNSELFPTYYLVNTHDIITRIFLSLASGKPLKTMWEYSLTPASVSTIEIYPEMRIVDINNTEHLYV
jgi:broad specificity phosphatase PhoE